MTSDVTRPAAAAGPAAAPYLNLLVTMVMFGSAFASSKVVVEAMPHQMAAALRFGGGGVLLIVLAAVLRRRSAPIGRTAAVRAGLIGLLGVLAYNFFFFWGLSLAPALDGSIIVPVLSPILTTATLLMLRRERASWVRVVGLLVGLAGATVFLLGAGTDTTGTKRLLGDLVFVAGAACWAAYSVLSKSLLAGIAPLRATAWGTAVGGLGLGVLAAPTAGDVAWSAVSGLAWANVVFLAVGPTAIAYLFYYRGLRSVSASTATVMMFTVPVFGTFFSTVFLGESFTGTQLTGTVVMLAGALLAVLGNTLIERTTGLRWSADRQADRQAEEVS
ncbi:drug/metabolite transporter (DMT)-like permease [Streptomyces luteogriseus]|uniref:DMT family transporter n=1 Tax=Streptomyces luteogriseus TaxID=68233 RepID=UPI00278AB48C|nr:DMT family transporter [Streptomyces luteogriseus]MDQ0715101.1 drug/metabolite transporter (DMT)-like permease [Streptomyces luteogriseus]